MANQRERKRSFDSKWLVLVIIIIPVILTTVMLNKNHTDDSANKINGTISADNGDLKIDWSRYPTSSIELSESLTITKSGTYHLNGSIENGYIAVNGDSTSKIRLILDSVSISNPNGPAIYCSEADDLVIEFTGDNALEDSSSYSSDFDTDVTGVIYSKGDLAIKGDGTLKINANYADGIVGKDDLKFEGGKYTIISKDDGIRGKDSVYIIDGDFNIKSEADAIKSTNETDGDKGFVMIEDGSFNIEASAKGIKAINSILIYGGDFALNTYDDAIHSNNYIGIIDGEITISANDDAIHADSELIIDGGKITISKAYEGLEAQTVTINNGDINIITLDDGINAGGGNDASSTNRPGANPFNADEKCKIVISGGKIHIDSSGDGVDSNGWVYFNGGEVTIDGPTNNGNGSLDSGMGIVQNGGEVIAVGSNGMAENLGQSSEVFNVSIYLDGAYPAKTRIDIIGSNNKTIISYIPAKTFSHIAVGTPDFEFGGTYTIYLDGEKYQSFTISDTLTTIGNSNSNQNMPPRNKP